MLTHIQALRGWAAMAVVLFHLGGALASPTYFGVSGLDDVTAFGYVGMFLFFVLSGFIIHQVHARDFAHPERVGRYCVKRVLRIFPLYLVLIVLVSVFALASGIGAATIPTDPATILRTLLLLPQNPEVVGGSGAPVIIVAWSLQYEMMFYAVMALFIVNRWLGLVSVAGLLLTWIGFRASDQGGLFPAFMQLKFFVFFSMGIVVSGIVSRGISKEQADRLRYGAVLGFALAYIATVATMVVTDGRTNLIGLVPFQLALGAMAAVLILGLTVAERLGAQPAGRVARRLGDWSYAIYLLHFPVISAAAKAVHALGLAPIPSAVLVTVLALAVTLAGAALLHAVVEKPAMALVRPRAERASIASR